MSEAHTTSCFNCRLSRTEQILGAARQLRGGVPSPGGGPDPLCRKPPRTRSRDTCSPPATSRGKRASQDARHTSPRSLTPIWHV